jgi:hypothetical protein
MAISPPLRWQGGDITFNERVLNVRNYGAVADGSSHPLSGYYGTLAAAQAVYPHATALTQEIDWAAIQGALNAARTGLNGRVVYAPSGNYYLNANLSIPEGVTLKGTWHSGQMNKRTGGWTIAESPTVGGTTFSIKVGSGTGPVPGAIGSAESTGNYGTAFLTVGANATVEGITFYQPDQLVSAYPPVTYPFAVALRHNNPTIRNCQLYNVYNGIDARFNERFRIENVHGQPLACGIHVDKIYDVGRIRDVHFLPHWALFLGGFTDQASRWSRENARALVFGRADWIQLSGVFCYGYNIGLDFVETVTETFEGASLGGGSCNGEFSDFGMDDCDTGVYLREAEIFGLHFTNFSLVGVYTSGQTGSAPVPIRIASTYTGVAQFVNGGIWGSYNHAVHASASSSGPNGVIKLNEITMRGWNQDATGRYAIDLAGPSGSNSFKPTIQNIYFAKDAPHFRFTGRVQALVDSLTCQGALQFLNSSTLGCTIGGNLLSNLLPEG